MKVLITRENLLAAASRAASFASKKSGDAILSHALFSSDGISMSVCATDLEKQIVDRVELAEEADAGHVVLPVTQIADIAKKIPAGALVSIEAGNVTATIKAGRYRTTLNTHSADDFPQFDDGVFPCQFTMPASRLKAILQIVSFAMSSDETRYYLCGIHIHTDGDKLKFVSTDGHRLAVARTTDVDINGDMGEGVIVPRSMVTEICRLLDGDAEVTVSMNDTRIEFEIGSARIASKLIDGKFPDYQRVIPKGNSIKASIPKSLSNVIDRVSAASTEKSRPIKLSLNGGTLNVSWHDQTGNTAQDEIDIDENDAKVDVGFQARYVQDMLSVMIGNGVWMFDNETNPVIVKDDKNENILFVIMPMRV